MENSYHLYRVIGIGVGGGVGGGGVGGGGGGDVLGRGSLKAQSENSF